ncbi:hypothetical protein O0L34_g7545 [Tuta absoluta]|nr:hypothetical protein O0L34_g7545 [Tuta absoluta]
MKLLFALAFIALASAAPEVSPVKVVNGPTPSEDVSPIKVVDAPVVKKISPIQVAYSPAESVADEVSPVKVIDAPLEVPHVQIPMISPEMFQDARNLVDISPAYVSEDVFEQADNVKVVNGIPVGIVPREMWRGPAPMMEEQKIEVEVPVKINHRDIWRGPVPIDLPKVLAPRPAYWRDMPQADFRPVYHFDNILR